MMVSRYAILCVALSALGSLSKANAQTPALDYQYGRLRARIEAFNAKCRGVRDGSDADKWCKSEQAQLEADKAAYNAAVAAYNASLRSSAPVTSPSKSSVAQILAQERQQLAPTAIERAKHANPVSKMFRNFLSEKSRAVFERQYGFVKDPALHAHLAALVNKLLSANPYSDESIKVEILNEPKYPKQTQSVGEEIVFLGADHNVQIVGNTIYVGRNYLMRSPPPTDDEVLFVLGHELGHFNRDHQTDKTLKVMAARMPDMFVSDQTTLSPKQREFMKDQSMKADWLAAYTKAQETQADRDGAYLAIAAGAKTSGIRHAFDWMQAEEASRPAPTAAEEKRREFTRDHPEPEARWRRLQEIYGGSLR